MLNKKIATKDDYKLVLDIWEKSVNTTHHFLAEKHINFYRNFLKNNLDHINLYLWEDDSEVLGFSAVSADELVMLFLDPAFIGKGYGSKILINLIDTENIKRIDVNTQNNSAKKFYVDHGFEIESEDELDGFGKPYPITHLHKK